jgi:hypothetical protein
MKEEIKDLGNTSIADVKKTTSDVEVFGNGDAWLLICKASSKSQGWMKSTKAMEIKGQGCLVQVTTEHRSNGLTQVTACSDSVTFVPGVRIDTITDCSNVIERKLVNMYPMISPVNPSLTEIKEKNENDDIVAKPLAYIGESDKTTRILDKKI